MLSFESDYTEGATEEILQKFISTNLEKVSGYGQDKYCESAKNKIRNICNLPNADIHFLTGGTQTNQIIIDSILKSYEGVITPNTGHISLHEAGAIEYTGHKVLEIPSYYGKIKSEDLENYIKTFYEDENHEHMVSPGMVYISYPTEYGTIYSKKELETIYQICNKYKLPLYIDGARLGYGLMAENNDVTLPFIAKCCDVFYIGGTKVGALCGEAVIFTKNNTPKNFTTFIKQHGALLAKGRLLGIQFDTLFTDNLYFKISTHAIKMAEKLKNILETKGYKFYAKTPTNQQFIIIDNKQMKELSSKVKFSYWSKYDNNSSIIRFATSWATKEQDLEELNKIL